MPGQVVDGMDVEVVYQAASLAIKQAREKKGPYLLEGNTYRFFGHGASDHRPYRTREEENEWKKKCPVCTFKDKLISRNPGLKNTLQKIEEEVEGELNKAVSFMEKSPEPDPEEVLRYVYNK
jgi:pyruvate dehydrogenase E1 component alpha subunit